MTLCFPSTALEKTRVATSACRHNQWWPANAGASVAVCLQLPVQRHRLHRGVRSSDAQSVVLQLREQRHRLLTGKRLRTRFEGISSCSWNCVAGLPDYAIRGAPNGNASVAELHL